MPDQIDPALTAGGENSDQSWHYRSVAAASTCAIKQASPHEWAMQAILANVEAPHPKQLASFIRATALLALPAAEQAAWLESLAIDVPVDELALEFEDGYLLLSQWVEAGWLPAESVAAFTAVNACLSCMSGQAHAQLWTTEALSRAPEWARVRDLASAALHRI